MGGLLLLKKAQNITEAAWVRDSPFLAYEKIPNTLDY